VALAFALATHGTLAWLARAPGVATGEDDAEYISLARALRQGQYTQQWRVDVPVESRYPPGYPALLAAWGGVTGDHYDALAALTVALSVATLLLVFVLLQRRFDVRVALASTVVLALNPALVDYGGAISSEIPYTFFTIACLLMLVVAERHPVTNAGTVAAASDPERPALEIRWLTAALIAAIFAALTRSIGITLVGAVGLYLLLQRRWKTAAAFALASALTVGAWLLWTALAGDQAMSSAYMTDLRAMRGTIDLPIEQRAPRWLALYATLGLAFSLGTPTIPRTPVDNALIALVLGASLVAGVWVFLKRLPVAALYLLAYAGLLAFWVWYQERFLVPVIVLVVPAILVGCMALVRRLNERWAAPAAVLLAALLAASGGVRSLAHVAQASRCDRSGEMPADDCLRSDQASFMAALRYIRANLPEDAVFLTAKTAPLYFYTGRRSVAIERSMYGPKQSFLSNLHALGAGYILLATLHVREPQRLAAFVEAHCGGLALAEKFPPRTYLFRVRGPGEPPDDGAACAAAAEYRMLNRNRDFDGDP
jgi:4-amino-4-deoxy-L-arabinose transferase-like glycosyltransferase